VNDLPFRVLPAVDETNEFFWTSGQDGRLRFLRCQGCGYYLHPPGPRCPECGGHDLRPEAVSGRATVASWTVNHHQWALPEDPWVIAIVELPEQPGLRLTTNIVGCGVDEVHIDQAVTVTFEHHADVWFPLFTPVAG
jgi:uncharacterized OB-fold protein